MSQAGNRRDFSTYVVYLYALHPCRDAAIKLKPLSDTTVSCPLTDVLCVRRDRFLSSKAIVSGKS